MRTLSIAIICVAMAACGSSNGKGETAAPPVTGGDELPPDDSAERPMMTVEECEAQGTVVGDIGDGAVHRPDYRCPNGEAPIGRVPSGIEGAVCCPGDSGQAEAGCAEGGWPQPTGEIAQGCEAVHAGCCYPSSAQACAAAGCAADDCAVMESYPMQVRCE